MCEASNGSREGKKLTTKKGCEKIEIGEDRGGELA